jgi:hypothetical protein
VFKGNWLKVAWIYLLAISGGIFVILNLCGPQLVFSAALSVAVLIVQQPESSAR